MHISSMLVAIELLYFTHIILFMLSCAQAYGLYDPCSCFLFIVHARKHMCTSYHTCCTIHTRFPYSLHPNTDKIYHMIYACLMNHIVYFSYYILPSIHHHFNILYLIIINSILICLVNGDQNEESPYLGAIWFVCK